jgi:hypothetical protein
VSNWRFGLAALSIERSLRQLAVTAWHPELIVIECFTTFWWEGAAEVARCARAQFPRAQIALVGTYPRLAPEHARANVEADLLLDTLFPEPFSSVPDLALYPKPPALVYLTFKYGGQSAAEIVDQVEATISEHGTRTFAIADHAVIADFPDLFRSVLDGIIARKLKTRLYALGNIAPLDLVEQPDLPALMKRAGYLQICFSDDRDCSIQASVDQSTLEVVRAAAALCTEAGFRERSDQLVGSVCIGRPGESLHERAQLTTQMAHLVGSVMLWPYQPSPRECPDLPLEAQNGKLFPLRTHNRATYRTYRELIGLATILNSKYRGTSFDFLGDGLIARLFRDGLSRTAWEPAPDVKGLIKLPFIQRLDKEDVA